MSRIYPEERLRRLHLNDLNVPWRLIRLFDCFLRKINDFTFRKRFSTINLSMIKQSNHHLWGSQYPQASIANSYVVSRGTCLRNDYVHEQIVTVHGGSRWKQHN